MRIWPYSKFAHLNHRKARLTVRGLGLSPYVGEYLAAVDRTEAYGFEAPMRLLVKKDCVDTQALQPVLLDFFERSPPDSMIDQTAATHFVLVPLLYDKTGIPFNLTIGGLAPRQVALPARRTTHSAIHRR